MTKIYDYNGIAWSVALTEDPRSGSNELYFFNAAHDKKTFTPLHNAQIRYDSANKYNYRFYPVGDLIQINGMNGSTYRNNHLHLSKPTVHVAPWSTYSDANVNIPDQTSWRFMDSTMEKGLNIQEITYDGHKTILEFFGQGAYGYKIKGTQSIDSDTPLYKTDWYGCEIDTNGYYPPVLIQQTPGHLHFLRQVTNTGDTFYPYFDFYTIWGHWPRSYDGNGGTGILGGGSFWQVQYLGKGTDDYPLVVQTYSNVGTDSSTIKITKAAFLANSNSTPIQTLMATLGGGSIAASGTHAGGLNRANNAFTKACSKIFTDPRDANKKVFYYTYFDQNGAYHPFVITWNKTNDVFAIETDISITGLKSSDIFDNLGSSFIPGSYSPSGINTETWVSGGTRYVAFIQYCMKANPQESNKKYMVTYTVDPTNPKALTYHSHIIFDEIVRNYVWLNDSYTMLGVFHKEAFAVWSWDNTNGWVKTTNISERVYACGRDSMDRIWYTTNSGVSTDTNWVYPNINILQPTAALTIAITPENTQNEYSGTNVNTYINVNVYDVNGNRIAADVKLVIDSSSYKFSDDTLIKTITTSATVDTQVNTVITGSGYTSINASIVV